MMENRLFFCNALLLTIVFGAVRSFVLNVEESFVASQVQEDIDFSSYRLPKEIVPISYDLSIYTRLGVNDFAYQGCVNITIEVNETTNTVVVHNDGLIIHRQKTFLYRRIGETVESTTFPIESQRHDKERQFYIIKFSTLLKPGVYVLVLRFHGEVRNDVFGFYRSSYVDNEEIKWMGITQFSPTYARRAFPCMDEPHLKAYFTLHVGHVGNQMVTSNTGIESTVKYSLSAEENGDDSSKCPVKKFHCQPGPKLANIYYYPFKDGPQTLFSGYTLIYDTNNTDYSVTTFLRTPRMSTYLVGWAVHDFASETLISLGNFKMWMRESMNNRGSIALNQGLPIYQFLEGWFQIDNPIPKMDQVAVADFNFHAMENWGMITYRESVVLFETGVTPTKMMVSGFTTMAHEYAHTWFGNLVTPMFWNVAWLKEGFASYFQYFALSSVQPEWRMMDKFVVDMLQPTLLLDAANHTRVMNGRNVGSPSSIMAVLDFVSYKKGASVIRMLSHVIGHSAFQNGLRSYLKNMSYQAASPFDLYEYLQISSDKSGQLQNDINIKNIMESWTNLPGFPLVSIRRNYTMQTLTVSQERFRQYNYESLTEHETAKWWIPLNFVEQSSIRDFSRTTAKQWLRPEDKSLTIASVPSEDWVIFNIQQIGYYRVNYDENNWRMLINYLRSKDFKKIHRVNRATLIDDAFNLARAGYIDYTIPFNLSSYLIQESDYEPWVAATNNFKFLNKMLSSKPDVHRAFQEHVVRLLEPMYRQLSFNESPCEDITTKLHRELILTTSCSVRNAHCLRTSETLFFKWISTPNKPLMQDVKSFVYCEGIRNGDENDWYTLWDKLMLADLQTEQELLLQGLGCTRRPNLIDKYLEFSISDQNRLRKQYRTTIVNAVLEGDVKNVERTLKIVRHNLQKIIHSRGYEFLSKVITSIGNAMTTEEQTGELQSFVNESADVLGSALSAAKQALVASSTNVEWIKKYSASIANSLT